MHCDVPAANEICPGIRHAEAVLRHTPRCQRATAAQAREGRGEEKLTKYVTLSLILSLSLLLSGCAGTRPIGDALLGAGGGLLGHELSDGNPMATAGGAAGGVLLSEGLHYLAGKESQKAFATGYDKGKSDAVKQQYWLYVSLQRQRNRVSNVRLYPVQLPEQRIDGVTFQPTTKYLRIEE